MCLAFDQDFARRCAEELTKAYGPYWPNFDRPGYDHDGRPLPKEGLSQWQATIYDITKLYLYKDVELLPPGSLVIFAVPKCDCEEHKFIAMPEERPENESQWPVMEELDMHHDDMQFVRETIKNQLPHDLRVLHMYKIADNTEDRPAPDFTQVIRFMQGDADGNKPIEIGHMSILIDWTK